MSDHNTQDMVIDYHDQVAIRREKLAALREKGIAYPNTFKPTHFAGDINEEFQNTDVEQLAAIGTIFSLCGRITNRRIMGKASFIHIQDFSGKIQVYVRSNDLEEGLYAQFKHWDLGDIVYVCGTVFRTKMGELTIQANDIALVTKALRPMPDKFHGLADKEAQYRQRYLDLISNEHSRAVFMARSQAINVIRNFLVEARFLEVETPMMHVMAGGAAAKPFATHHNALDLPLYMRIAPELFLKRLLVGGFDRVFEINRNFRNEGLSTRHNPEFTMLEFYQAYADYEDFMDFVETLLRTVIQQVAQADSVSFHDQEIHFGVPFQRLTMLEAIVAYNKDITMDMLLTQKDAYTLAKSLGIPMHDDHDLGQIQLDIFEETVEKQLIQPTFIMRYPTIVSPLSRKNDHDPAYVDRCELFIGGQEVANIFSELNDPEDQAERFAQQLKEKQAGDDEAMDYDHEYVEALEYGMPPAAGAGIGIDRLVMILTNSPAIRDVILFPLLRPLVKDQL